MTPLGGRRGLYSGIAAALVLAVFFLISLWLFSQAPGNDVDAAGPNDPSYEFTDFEIIHPFENQEDVAGVAFGATWTTDEYPGEVHCVITLSNGQGEVVATYPLDFSSELRAVPKKEPQPIEVSGPPESASSSCGPGGDPISAAESASDYTFSEPIISKNTEDDSGETDISFKVGWNSDTDPVEERCWVRITLQNGESKTEGPWEISIPRGEKFSVHTAVGAPAEIKDAEVTCEESNG